ncbi:hypothetical protein P3L10_033157 [Capsicum annuum]
MVFVVLVVVVVVVVIFMMELAVALVGVFVVAVVVSVFVVFVCWHWLVVFAVVTVGKTCLPKEKKVKVDQRLTTQKKATVQRDSEELPEQSQSGKSEVEEIYENNIEGGGQGFVDGDEENQSEKEEELESEKEKENDHQHDDNRSPMGRELISISQHDPIKTFSIDRFQVAVLINDLEAK